MAEPSIPNWKGLGVETLNTFLKHELGEKGTTGEPNSFGVDIFNNGFEDEFPTDNIEAGEQPYVTYSPEANRAADLKPWGRKFGERPKVHELNQPLTAQILGWRVVDFYPNRDRKAEFYRLAGTPAELRVILQLLQATRTATGNNAEFEAFMKQWEGGFADATLEREAGNFPLSGEKMWGRVKKPESRPRWREWTSSTQRADWGYRVIEYWRDRSIESESIILAGTDLELIRHIIQIEYEGGGAGQSAKSKPGRVLTGQPFVTIKFKEVVTNKSQLPDYPEKIFRLMDVSDKPNSQKGKITDGYLKTLCQQIHDQFVTSNFEWEYGKKCVSYKGAYPKEQGVDGWAYVNTTNTGIELFTRLLACTGQTPDAAYWREGGAVDEAKAFPQTAQQTKILNRSYEIPVKRRRFSCKFHSAVLTLPFVNQEILLLKGAVKSY